MQITKSIKMTEADLGFDPTMKKKKKKKKVEGLEDDGFSRLYFCLISLDVEPKAEATPVEAPAAPAPTSAEPAAEAPAASADDDLNFDLKKKKKKKKVFEVYTFHFWSVTSSRLSMTMLLPPLLFLLLLLLMIPPFPRKRALLMAALSPSPQILVDEIDGLISDVQVMSSQ